MIRSNSQGIITRINRMDIHNMTDTPLKSSEYKEVQKLITPVLEQLARFGNPTIKGITLFPKKGYEFFLWTTPFSGFKVSPVELANPDLEDENNKQFCVSIIDVDHNEENPCIVPKSLRTQW
tara:strand:- start:725 stop:1090 length:366 start_codon:yes stop_codon:yes gene_type:complete